MSSHWQWKMLMQNAWETHWKGWWSRTDLKKRIISMPTQKSVCNHHTNYWVVRDLYVKRLWTFISVLSYSASFTPMNLKIGFYRGTVIMKDFVLKRRSWKIIGSGELQESLIDDLWKQLVNNIVFYIMPIIIQFMYRKLPCHLQGESRLICFVHRGMQI